MTDAAATEYKTDQRILEFALEYASYDIAIFPCKQNKAPHERLPVIDTNGGQQNGEAGR
jgi:hypothetical protein